MMNLYQQNKSGAKTRLILSTLLVGVLFVVDLISGGALRGILKDVSLPVLSKSRNVASAITGSGFLSPYSTLAAHNRVLLDEVSQSDEQAAAYTALQAQDTQLRALVHLASTETGVTAPVISSARTSPYGTFMIGAGSADAIISGSIALSSDGFVVGRITNIDTHSALVEEVFASNASVDGLLNGATVKLTGIGGSNATADVPRGISIAPGDIVTSPAFRNRPLGVVGKVESDSSSAYSTVYISLPVNLSTMQYVYVVADPTR